MPAPVHDTTLRPGAPPAILGARTTLALLLTILLAAAILRLAWLRHAPPGLNQDEASNAWNAWCILKTGRDQVGEPWPIFCTRALGENRSALFVYVIIPFQAVGGLNIWTTRLPAVVAGLLTVLLAYWVAARLFDRPTGLTAAALLAINPIHLQLTRWGHEASITPLLTLLPLAALLWAGLPLADANPGPRPLRALLAGLLTGVCCYGYPAVRLFVPVFLTAGVLITWRAWWQLLKTRRGVLTLAGLIVGVAVTFGPLAYKHITEPEVIGKRGRSTWVWYPEDPLATRVGNVAERYVFHFGPEFLFQTGDADEIVWTAGFGFLPRYTLPLQLLGLIVLVPKLPRSRSGRLLLAGVLLFPVADCLNWHVSLHALRSSTGLFPLLLLTSLGIPPAAAYLYRQRVRAWLLAAVAALAGLVIPETVGFLKTYFHDRQKQITIYNGNHVSLVEACDWLRPRLDDVDAVLGTTISMNHPYLIPLVHLSHDPHRWFAEPREVFLPDDDDWDYYARYGKFHFLYDERVDPRGRDPLKRLDELTDPARPQRFVLFLRDFEPAPAEPVHRIIGADGKTSLLIYDVTR